MTDRVLIPFRDSLLVLTAEQFAEAQAAGAEFVPSGRSALAIPVVDELLTAEQLEERTSVPANWWETAAREDRVPHKRIGRYVRFRFAEVAGHFDRPLDCNSAGAVRQWRKSGT